MKRRALLQFLSLTPLIALFKPRMPGSLGSELVTNGGFDTETNWVKRNGFVMWADQSGNGNHMYGHADMIYRET